MQLITSASILAADFGLSDLSASLATVAENGNVRLIFSARSSNLLASTVLGAGSVSGGEGPAFGMHFTQSGTRLLNYGAMNAPLAGSILGAGGAPGAAVSLLLGGQAVTNVDAMQVLDFAGGDLAIFSHRPTSPTATEEARVYRLSDTGTLSAVSVVGGGAKTYLDTVSDMAYLTRGAERLLLTLSASEDGISSFRVTGAGAVEWIDSIGAANGVVINGGAMLQTLSLGGIDYAVIASTNASALTVLRVNEMGVFFAVDEIYDTRDTRFRAIAAFDSFSHQGRQFLVAAGTDAGITLIEMLPDGRLTPVQSFILEGASGLQGVSALKVQIIGTTAQIYLIDARADRILHFDLPLNGLGGLVTSGQGGALDERLWGGAGAESLVGAGGDDWLHDGAGADTLHGGAGADVFVLAHDGAIDRISDFTDGVDRIDLSSWGRVYTYADLNISAKPTGAEITFGDERLLVTSSTGGSLLETGWSNADFIF